MKHLRYLLMAALVAMPLTACDEDDDPVVEVIAYGTVTGSVSADGSPLVVDVTLVGQVSQTAASTGGSYTFTNVPAGSYGVTIDASSQPEVLFAATSKTTTISQANETVTVDFTGSYIKTSSITGFVTAGGNAVGATVSLTGGPESVSESTGTAGGAYAFTGLRAGTYTVAISDIEAGYNFATTQHSVTVGVGESQAVHFSGDAVEMAAISGAVTVDGEGVVAVAVTLSGGADATTETGAGGSYSFTNLTPGTYTVTITPPADATFDATSKTLTVGPGETGVASFVGYGPIDPATISIKSITFNDGGTVVPVDLDNVFDQIEVTLNIERNDDVLKYVDIVFYNRTTGEEVVMATQIFPVLAAPEQLEMQGGVEEAVLNVQTTQLKQGTTPTFKGDVAWVPAAHNGAWEVGANLIVDRMTQPIPSDKKPIVLQNPDMLLAGTAFGGDIEFFPTDQDTPGYMALEDGVGPEEWYKGGATARGWQWLAYTTEVPEDFEFDLEYDQDGYEIWSDDIMVVGNATDGAILVSMWDMDGVENDDIELDWNDIDDVEYADDIVGPDGTPLFWYNDEETEDSSDGIATIGAMYYLSDPANPVGPRRYIVHPRDVQQEGQVIEPDEFNFDNLGARVYMRYVAFNPLWDEFWINDEFDLILGVDQDLDDDYDDPIYLMDYGVGPDHSTREARIDPTYTSGDDMWWCLGTVVTNADLDPTVTSSEVDGHRICGWGYDFLMNPPILMYWDYDGSDLDMPNFFGKDIMDPVLEIAQFDRQNFIGFSQPPLAEDALDHPDNLFNIADPYDDGVVDPRGWGLDASDDAAGFHQDFTGTGVGPAVQTVSYYYPDKPNSTDTEMDTFSGTTWLGLQLTVPGETWVRSSDIGFGAGFPAEDLVDPTGDGDNPGLYLYEGWATDMAGNTTYITRNFAIDQVMGPVLAQIEKDALQYWPGSFGGFRFYGEDDFEVDQLQIGMTYLTTLGDFNLWYPSTTADPSISPWDMDYPFDELEPFVYSAGFADFGIAGRMDFTDDTGGLDLVDNGDDGNVDGPDLDALAEDDDMLPYQIYGWIATDILGNPTEDTDPFGPVDFVSYDFGGWGDTTAEPWTAVEDDFVMFSLIDKLTGTSDFGDDFTELVAEHVTTKSIVAPFFDKVFLVHNDADVPADLTVCAEMSVLVRTDEGVNRYYRYSLPAEVELPDVCDADREDGDSFHAAGLKGDALLVTHPAVSLDVTVGSG